MLQKDIQAASDRDRIEKENFRAEANEIRSDLPVPEPTRIAVERPAKNETGAESRKYFQEQQLSSISCS